MDGADKESGTSHLGAGCAVRPGVILHKSQRLRYRESSHVFGPGPIWLPIPYWRSGMSLSKSDAVKNVGSKSAKCTDLDKR